MTTIHWRVCDFGGGPTLVPDPRANFTGVRLGMAMTPLANGAPGFTYSIVGRQRGERVWRLDFHEERQCECEMETIRGLLKVWSEGVRQKGYPTSAYRVSNFDPQTGRITMCEEIAPVSNDARTQKCAGQPHGESNLLDRSVADTCVKL